MHLLFPQPYCPGFNRKKRDLSSTVIVESAESDTLVDRQKRQASPDIDIVILNDKVIVKATVNIGDSDGLDEDTDDVDIITSKF